MMKKVLLVGYSIGLLLFLTACDTRSISTGDEKKVGYFVSVFNKTVDYRCEDKREALQDSGKFECTSFPITFYMEETKIGEINTIHKDGYVYPQDIIVLEEKTPVYSSQGNLKFLAVE
ncbi:MAG TPA: hypothetical protein ENK94_03020 [Campylobacterales bacterium]|nr:hypothetical protein [Campylobacterales bacterium]